MQLTSPLNFLRLRLLRFKFAAIVGGIQRFLVRLLRAIGMMLLGLPFSILIFVADGGPSGLRIGDKSNRIDKALVFPRALPPRPDGEDDTLYVGDAPHARHAQALQPATLSEAFSPAAVDHYTCY